MEQVKPGIMITNGYSGCLRIWGREGDIDGEEKQELPVVLECFVFDLDGWYLRMYHDKDSLIYIHVRHLRFTVYTLV